MTAKWLADECLPLPIVTMLRARGDDVRYAAGGDHRASDEDQVAIAQGEGRIIVTEDFDFGDLLVRRRLPAPGGIVVFMPDVEAAERARCVGVMATQPDVNPFGHLTILARRRIRQRKLEPQHEDRRAVPVRGDPLRGGGRP